MLPMVPQSAVKSKTHINSLPVLLFVNDVISAIKISGLCFIALVLQVSTGLD